MSTSAMRRISSTNAGGRAVATTLAARIMRGGRVPPPSRRLLSTARCSTAEQLLSEPTAPRQEASRWMFLATRRLAAHRHESSSSMQQQHSQRRFFVASSSNGKAGDEPPPGTASIAFVGASDDEADNSADASEDIENPADYTVPIVITMPPMDDVGGDESHCFVETWHKAEGDWVRLEDVLCDISTPDFVFGMQIDDSELGLLKEIHVAEGVRVPDHAPLCTIYHKAAPPAEAEAEAAPVEPKDGDH